MEKAKKIAEDINEQVFAPIRESLKKIHNIGDKPNLKKTAPETADAERALTPPAIKEESKKEYIMKEIEGSEEVEEKEKITSPFEAKLGKEEVFKMPREQSEHKREDGKSSQITRIKEELKKKETTYPQGDPYRESVD